MQESKRYLLNLKIKTEFRKKEVEITGQFTVLFASTDLFTFLIKLREKSHRDQGGRKSGKKSECRCLLVCDVNDLI